jgi:hypothetical protein
VKRDAAKARKNWEIFKSIGPRINAKNRKKNRKKLSEYAVRLFFDFLRLAGVSAANLPLPVSSGNFFVRGPII